MARDFEELAGPIMADPLRRARVEDLERAMLDAVELARLRERRRQTQHQVADAMEVSQARVWKIEHAHDLYLSTLRKYVAALGGQLEINAVFPDEVIPVVSGSDTLLSGMRG